MLEVKICPRCQNQFVCKGKADCFCSNYELSNEQRNALKMNYNDCVCEQCLQFFSKNTD